MALTGMEGFWQLDARDLTFTCKRDKGSRLGSWPPSTDEAEGNTTLASSWSGNVFEEINSLTVLNSTLFFSGN